MGLGAMYIHNTLVQAKQEEMLVKGTHLQT
mgnify:CR=1 FL=1